MSDVMSMDDAEKLVELRAEEIQETPEGQETETQETETEQDLVEKEAEVEAEAATEVEEEIKEKVEEPHKGLDKRLAKLLAERKLLKEKVEQLELTSLPETKVLDPNDYQDLESYKQAYAQQGMLRFQREQKKLIQAKPEIKALIEDDVNRSRLGIKTVNDTMATLIKDSPVGAKLWYHLLSEPEEAIRIAGLSPLASAREIGKIELLLEHEETETPTKPTKKPLPAPPKPVKSSTAAIPKKGIENRFVSY